MSKFRERAKRAGIQLIKDAFPGFPVPEYLEFILPEEALEGEIVDRNDHVAIFKQSDGKFVFDFGVEVVLREVDEDPIKKMIREDLGLDEVPDLVACYPQNWKSMRIVEKGRITTMYRKRYPNMTKSVFRIKLSERHELWYREA